MRPSEEGLREFINIYKEIFGKNIELDAAREMATRIIILYARLANPLPEDEAKLP